MEVKLKNDSYKSHFALGYRSISPAVIKKPQETRPLPMKIIHKSSSVCLGTHKTPMKSISGSEYTLKQLPDFRNCLSPPKRSKSSFPENVYNKNGQSKKIDLNKHLYLNKTQIKIPHNNDLSHTKHNPNTSDSIYFPRSHKLDYITNAMEYKPNYVEKTKSLKIPDSVIFNPSTPGIYLTTQNQNFKKITEKAAQAPVITTEFMRSQHYSLGNLKPEKKFIDNPYFYTKDSCSSLKNREKVLGSSIDLGYSNKKYSITKNTSTTQVYNPNKQYKTCYENFYEKNELDYTLAIPNNKSSVFIGTSKPWNTSEYSLEYIPLPITNNEMPYPRNKIQSINVFTY
jgi:hypothetical protein